MGTTLREAVYNKGHHFIRDVEWEDRVEVYSALITKKLLLANRGDYIAYSDHLEVSLNC